MSQPNLKVVSCSPEREFLAVAIDQHRKLTAAVSALRAAKKTASDALFGPGSARAKVDAAEAAVNTAKSAATQHLIDVAMGNAGPAPLSVKTRSEVSRKRKKNWKPCERPRQRSVKGSQKPKNSWPPRSARWMTL